MILTIRSQQLSSFRSNGNSLDATHRNKEHIHCNIMVPQQSDDRPKLTMVAAALKSDTIRS